MEVADPFVVQAHLQVRLGLIQPSSERAEFVHTDLVRLEFARASLDRREQP
jgi:hypothetical protein